MRRFKTALLAATIGIGASGIAFAAPAAASPDACELLRQAIVRERLIGWYYEVIVGDDFEADKHYGLANRVESNIATRCGGSLSAA